MADPLVTVFTDPDLAARALRELNRAEVVGTRVVSPAPFPAVHLTGRPGPWRILGKVALLGGITGLVGAALLEALTSRSLGLIVGGKPILAWPAFGVIMFELTMLFAGVANFVALVILAGASRRQVPAAARAEVNGEQIVVVVPADQLEGARGEAVRRALAGEAQP
jgi:Alternative complex III, ActD subunit